MTLILKKVYTIWRIVQKTFCSSSRTLLRSWFSGFSH